MFLLWLLIVLEQSLVWSVRIMCECVKFVYVYEIVINSCQGFNCMWHNKVSRINVVHKTTKIQQKNIKNLLLLQLLHLPTNIQTKRKPQQNISNILSGKRKSWMNKTKTTTTATKNMAIYDSQVYKGNTVMTMFYRCKNENKLKIFRKKIWRIKMK